jgi:hypothetical protein
MPFFEKIFRGLIDSQKGELLPLQGGTNEMIIHAMYKDLETQYKDKLNVHFYVGKDQTKPINAKFRHRNCHSQSHTLSFSFFFSPISTPALQSN